MAIATAYLPVKLSGDGVTVAFSFGFRVYSNTDLKVSWILKTTGEVSAVKVLSTDYTVAINANSEGGIVTFGAGDIPPSTVWVLIESIIPKTQPTVLGVDSKLSEKSIETMVDRQCRLSQQAAEAIDRSLKLPPALASAGIDMNLPGTLEGGKVIGLNADADGFQLYEADSGVAAAEAEAAAAEAAASAVDASGYADAASASADAASSSADDAAASAIVAQGAGGIIGSYKNKLVTRPTVATVRAVIDSIIVGDTDGNIFRIDDFDETADVTASGANGLDTGVEGNSPYYIWAIRKSSDGSVALLLSLSSTAPTMPSGYDQKALISGVYNSSGDFVDFIHQGEDYEYVVTRSAYSSAPSGWAAIDITNYVLSGLSNRVRGVFFTTASQDAQITNDSTVSSTATTVAPNKIVTPAATSAIAGKYFELAILTANTIYGAGSSNINVYISGFKVNKL